MQHGLFISPEEQLAVALERNDTQEWGFTHDDFGQLGRPPAWPLGQWQAVVLDIGLDTMPKTFEAAWNCAERSFMEKTERGVRRWSEVTSETYRLRLLPGLRHEHSLRWRVIDLAANWDPKKGIAPTDVIKLATAPHSAVLWAASYFPTWIGSMGGSIGGTSPCVYICGYQFNNRRDSGESWDTIPGLAVFECFGPLELVQYYSYPWRGWATPEFIDQ